MSSGDKCKECGTAISADSPGGFCAQCLLGLGLREGQSLKSKVQSQAQEESGLVTVKPGDRIGRYRLLQEIGHGGGGVVYMAEQEEPVRRKVALKVIKLGMDTKQVVARFEAERQALALMDHPNIAKVLDAGATEMGRPYFVMELVGGIKITDYCEQNNLTTRQRLDLFVQVCRAIQHAHQKGIIHRDIKPSNVLVATHDGVPVPKVIDFGIAKATQGRLTDQTLFTAFEQFIGTPAYMSPEQAQLGGLDVDTRSDIYSLGVLLYELLTSKTPFDAKELLGAGIDAMRRTILEKEPPKPSTRLTQELAFGVPSSGGRASASFEHTETSGAEPAKTRTPNKSSTANTPSGGVRTPHDTKQLIHLVRGDLDWITMRCLEKDRARRYETANGLASDIERHLSNEPVVASPPSNLYRFQKLVRRNRAVFFAAAVAVGVLVLGAGVSTWQALRATRAEREQSRLLKDAQTAQVNETRERQRAQTEAAKNKEVARFLEEMLRGAGPSAARGRDATMLREIMDKTAERVEKDLKDQPEVQGDLNCRLALTYRDLGDFQKAERLLERAVEEYSTALGDEHCKVALALCYLGSSQSWLENRSLGKATAEKGLALARKCGDKKTLASCLFYAAQSLNKYGVVSVSEAEPYRREAVAIQRALGDDPVRLATYIGDLASCLDEPKEMKQLLHEALGLHRLHLGNDHPSVAADLYMLAQVLLRENELAEAKAAAMEAFELGRKVLGKDQVRVHHYLTVLVRVLVVRGEWDDAERILRQAVEESPSATDLWDFFVKFEVRRKNWPAAADYSARAIEVKPEDSGHWKDLAIVLLRSGRLEDYRTHCHRLLEHFADTREFTMADSAAKASLLLPVEGGDFQRACQLADFVATAKEPEWALPWFALCKALAEYRRGGFESAREWANRARSSGSIESFCKAPTLFVEAMAWSRSGNFESAKAALSAGDEIVKTDYADSQSLVNEMDWVVADLLRREAQGLMTGVPKTSEKAK